MIGRSGSPRASCLARTMPSRTPSAASRCEGLAAMYTFVAMPSSTEYTPHVPRWYFTSPLPWAGLAT